MTIRKTKISCINPPDLRGDVRGLWANVVIAERIKRNNNQRLFPNCYFRRSHQPDLHQAVSQSLAGRTAVLTLLPFSFNELKNYRQEWETYELITKGAFPRLHENDLQPERFFNGYLQTYVERDVCALINLKELGRFQQFLTLLAGRIGQIANYTSLSNDIGVSSTTVIK